MPPIVSLMSRSPMRTALALGLALSLGLALTLAWLLAAPAENWLTPPLRGALLGGCTAAAATALGTLPVLLSQEFSQRSYDGFLGFGAGVMLAATAFSLVVPAIAASVGAGASAAQASLIAGSGMLAGAAFVLVLERVTRSWELLPQISVERRAQLRRAWLFVAAVTIHNLPEGLAIGVSYAGADLARAHSLTTGISIQDVPEGLVVALALRTVGYGRLFAVSLGILSGLVEPVAAMSGAWLIDLAADALPWGLSMAAGAMLFVIMHDVVPESHRHGHGTVAACAAMAGFVLMMMLDTALA